MKATNLIRNNRTYLWNENPQELRALIEMQDKEGLELRVQLKWLWHQRKTRKFLRNKFGN